MKKTILMISAIAFAAFGTAANAKPCSPDQEAEAGGYAGGAAAAAVKKIVSVNGKQMVKIEACDAVKDSLNVTFKYNFLGPDGLYWVAATAKMGLDGSNPVLSVKGMSPNLAAAEEKSGTKLASN